LSRSGATGEEVMDAMKTILHVVDIDAPNQRVFDAITTEEGLSR